MSPFFIENYVDTDWEQSLGYCGFFIYLFTFHDLFVPLVLILLSSYVSLKFAGKHEKRLLNCKKNILYNIFYRFCNFESFYSLGATEAFQNYKKQVYIGLFVLCLLFSIFLAIPATAYSDIVTGRQQGMFHNGDL